MQTDYYCVYPEYDKSRHEKYQMARRGVGAKNLSPIRNVHSQHGNERLQHGNVHSQHGNERLQHGNAHPQYGNERLQHPNIHSNTVYLRQNHNLD
ncbi:MAG: hypothetical protein FWH22_03055 [Fibromonadales bacterium]|nr:hypothetical protein [Fibromonadales bacterium]